jgi:uncharacterized protein YydD (DUF2326 family)
LTAVNARLSVIRSDRQRLDADRAKVMELLDAAMALETFRSAEKDLTELDAKVADLERRRELALSITISDSQLKARMADAKLGVQAEISERSQTVEEAIALFWELGREIYRDRNVTLEFSPAENGTLKVIPKIDGDASTGISEVKTFLLDLVCTIIAVKAGRIPRILVHDSLLFDSMDDRQVASCLNIGARFAEEVGFQYIVTLNSDRLLAAEKEGFDRSDYVIKPILQDSDDTGGLFGFRFT